MSDQNENASLDSNPVLANVIARIASTNASEDAAANLAVAVKRDLKTLETAELTRPMEQSNMNTSVKSTHRHTPNWTSPTIKLLSAAAAIAVVGLAALAIIPAQSNVFANMQNAIAQLKTIQCNLAHFRPGEALPWETETIWIQEPNLLRSECNDETGDSFTVADLATGDYVSWWTATSQGTIGVLPDVELMKDVLCQFVGVLRNATLEEISQVDRYRGKDNEWVVEFEYSSTLVDGPTVQVNVVVNEVTSLPVEISFHDAEDNLVQKFTDLSFDQPLDPNLFLIELPEGYKVVDLSDESE